MKSDLNLTNIDVALQIAEYPKELAAVRDQYVQDEWIEDAIDHPVV